MSLMKLIINSKPGFSIHPPYLSESAHSRHIFGRNNRYMAKSIYLDFLTIKSFKSDFTKKSCLCFEKENISTIEKKTGSIYLNLT